MNGNRMGLVVVMIVLTLGTLAFAQAERPYIGIRLDPAPLPGLVVKHLKLEPEQGIRIRNVNVSSPADKIGLERDDIIIRFQGEDVTDLEQFVDAVKDAGLGTEVSLEIIHVGQRKSLQFELEPFKGDLKWKYPLEPEAVTSWQPGRFFKVGPEGQNWTTFQIDELPDIDVEVKKFFNQRHVYHHSTDGEDYTITIEGDPRDGSSQITVQSGDAKHSATVGELDALPPEYLDAAKDALEGARKSSRGRVRMKQSSLPKPPEPEAYRQYMREFKIPRLDVQPWSQKKDEMLEKLQKQMERLQERLDALEQRHLEKVDEMLEKRKERLKDEDDEAAGQREDRNSQTRPTV